MSGFTKSLILISALVLLVGGGFAFYFTYQGYQPATLINTDATGVAIDGYDPVAYHEKGAALRGQENYRADWADATWYFTSLENRQAFVENPEKYAPAYGGYDPYALAFNGTVQPAQPELWAIEEGRLYLFYSGRTRNLWQENRAENQRKAARAWEQVKQQLGYSNQLKQGGLSSGLPA